PAAMHLLGDSNWWLPAWLEKRLPHLAVEPKEEETAPSPAHGPSTVVHGFVRDASGDPVEGASVTLMSKGGRQLDRVTSLADGSYILSVPAPGTYLLSTTAPSYAAQARQVTVAGEPLVHDVELPEVSEVN
ncbi:carboxypeptidase regulatory-like domain-containing protein, partial [Streptomyces sp. NPDC002920]